MDLNTALKVGVPVVLLIVAGPLVFGLFNKGHSLEARLAEWDKVVTALPTDNRDADIQAICEYLQPSAARPTAASEFLGRATKAEWKIMASSVDGIQYNDDRNVAFVKYGMVITKGSEQKTHTDLVKWVKVKGTWYRAIDGSLSDLFNFSLPEMPKFTPPPTFTSPTFGSSGVAPQSSPRATWGQ